MTTQTTRRRRRLAAAVGAIAIGASGLLSATAAYSAPGNIDSTTAGSITINKHVEANATAVTPDGANKPAGAAIAGVQFTIYELNRNGSAINLSNATDWNGLSTVTLNADCSVSAPTAYTRGIQVAQVLTGADGSVTHSTGTDRKAYVVCETATVGATIAGAPANIVTPSAPFVVTVPTPFGNEWLYAVNAYPKNIVTKIEKTVASQPASGLGLGAMASFPVTTDIPVVAAADAIGSYIIRDTLDTRLAPVSVASVTVDGAPVDASFYEVKINAANAQDLRVVFTPAGLTWLKTQGGKKVVTTFAGTVASLGNGAITNAATVFINNPNSDADTIPPGTPPGISSSEVRTNWGDLLVQKSDAVNHKTLTGASFQVYAADPAYAVEGQTCTSKVGTGSPVSVGTGANATDTFTTGADGRVTIGGLFISDSTNAPINAMQRCYVLVETAAPAGYTLPTGDDARSAVTVKTGASGTTVDIDVPNTMQNVPQLPLTGAAGQVLLGMAGIALLAVAIGLVAVRRGRAAKL
ncbi:SpaH/EbpB family LPXTG-anchored major pilin [Arthrobacter sp. KNU40]|uniref:SpaH/EbpB family LPXTG-anchored major pilin n=1 Tax=Arthrobacter sp. KNU40 TaxID=3447965 RepID=UPI003F5D7558